MTEYSQQVENVFYLNEDGNAFKLPWDSETNDTISRCDRLITAVDNKSGTTAWTDIDLQPSKDAASNLKSTVQNLRSHLDLIKNNIIPIISGVISWSNLRESVQRYQTGDVLDHMRLVSRSYLSDDDGGNTTTYLNNANPALDDLSVAIENDDTTTYKNIDDDRENTINTATSNINSMRSTEENYYGTYINSEEGPSVGDIIQELTDVGNAQFLYAVTVKKPNDIAIALLQEIATTDLKNELGIQ